MPWIGTAPNQTYQRTDGTRSGSQTWQQANAAGRDIVDSDHDTHDQDIADAVSGTLKRDGGNSPTDNLPMGGFRHTNVGAAAARTSYVQLGQLQDGVLRGTVGGTANAITVTTGFSVPSIGMGFSVEFFATANNTGAVTINVDSLGAKDLVRPGNTALIADDIVSGAYYRAIYNGSYFQLVSSGLGGSQKGFGLRVGDVKLSLSSSADAGFVRLTDAIQLKNKADYPDLDAWASGQGYPWGSTSTQFGIPPAGGYFLRFGASGTSVDPGGPRAAGSTASDKIKSHTHGGSTSIVPTVSGNTIISAFSGSAAVAIPYGPGPSTATVYPVGSMSSADTKTISITTSTMPDGTSETAPKSVTMYADMLAIPAMVASGLIGVSGFAYKWNPGTTTTDPGSGYISFNDSSIGSATALYISETDSNGSDFSSVIASIPANTGFYITKVGAPSVFRYCKLTSSGTDNGSWRTFTVSNGTGSGTLTSGDSLTIVVHMAGATGAQGTTGSDGGIRFTYDSSTTMGAPSPGGLRFNNTSLASVTAFAISPNTAETGNPDISAWIRYWDDSTTTGHRGVLTVRNASDTSKFAIYDLVSDVTDNTTWLTGALSLIQSNGSFSASDTLLLSFYRTGDKGLDGAGSGSVTGITAGAGLSSSGVGSTGGSITVSGTLTQVKPVNAQTGTSYTFTASDHAKLVTFSNVSAVAVTLPQATTTFAAGWYVDVTNKGAGTVTITPTTSTIDGSATLTLAQGEGCRVVSDGANYQITRARLRASGVTAGTYTYATVTVAADGRVTSASSGSTAIPPTMPQGRLTLTTAVPILTSTVSAATTVYYTPYSGRYVPIYDGSMFTMTDTGGELSQTTTDASKSPAACTTNSLYDMFVWSDSGTIRCTRGPLWSSTSSRGTGVGTTELEWVGGFLVNKYAITNGPAAQRGTFVGTIASNGTSTVDFILGGIATGGTAGSIGLWNMYNQRPWSAFVGDDTNTWTYTTSSWRAADNSTNMSVKAVVGWKDVISAVYHALGSTTTNAPSAGIGYNSSTAYSGTTARFPSGMASGYHGAARYDLNASAGLHQLYAIEYGATGATFTGDNGDGRTQSGLFVTGRF